TPPARSRPREPTEAKRRPVDPACAWLEIGQRAVQSQHRKVMATTIMRCEPSGHGARGLSRRRRGGSGWAWLLAGTLFAGRTGSAPAAEGPAVAAPPLAYETSAYELAPELQAEQRPWRKRDLKRTI